MPNPFHLAIPVHDLDAARSFYVRVLGCGVGRSDAEWIDFDLFGHQVVAHTGGISPLERGEALPTSGVDGHAVPVPHFGVVLELDAFDALAKRLEEHGVDFVHPPTTRFAGLPGEQRTMFLTDPSGNALEFKAFRDIEASLFET
ncbi:MAG: VOC family protein [Myxococcota bacterium]